MTITRRPPWDKYFLGIAEAVSKRGDCTRRQVGAVIVDQNHRVISAGYNGTAPGQKSCLEGACPRGRHYKAEESFCRGTAWGDVKHDGYCACGTPWPCPDAVQSGSSYDTGPGTCISLHAELNALLYAFRSVEGMIMYITTEPCDGCLKLLRGARLHLVVTPASTQILDLS